MKIIFVGQNIMGGFVLINLVENLIIPSYVVTRNDNDYPNHVAQLCSRFKIPFIKTPDINSCTSAFEMIEKINPDCIYCCSWGNLIKEPLLSKPKIGWVNFHPSLLPKYRGPRPIEWQLIKGEISGGCSAHFMDKRIDGGPIILKKRINIDYSEDNLRMKKKCGKIMGELAVDCTQLLSKNPNYKGSEQDETKASYAPHWKKIRVIKWNRRGLEIHNLIRGLSPYPCAILQVGDYKIEVSKATIHKSKSFKSKPGEIRHDKNGKLIVSALDSIVKIQSIRAKDNIIKNYGNYIRSLNLDI